ncbi:hypothetical protein Tco_1429055 [Tanacetum coccineum]
MGSEPTMTLDNVVSSSELSSMSDDDLHSMSAFDTVKSGDDAYVDMPDSEHISKEGMADTFLNDFAEFHSLSRHLDHVCKEVSNLHSKITDMEPSILQSASDEIKNSVPTLISNALQYELPELLTDTLKACLPFILKDSLPTQLHKAVAKPMNKQFNIYYTTESEHFVTLQKIMQNQLTNIQGLLESAMSNDDTAEGEKNKKDKDANPAATQGEHQSAETIPSSGPTVESQGEQLADLKSVQEFTDQLFKTTSSKFSPTPPREPTPPRDSTKGKEVAIIKEQVNELVSYQEEGDREIKRLADMKVEKEKSKQELRKMFNQATLKPQAQKWTEHEAKKAKMIEEYNHQIFFRADPLPITKISYVGNPNKEATMKIIRGDNPLNLIVYPNFRLKTLGFSEWLEVHALASKKTRKSNDMLLQSLRAKFQWVINQAKKLGLPPPPVLATFGMTVEDKKRKRTEFLKEVFVTENITVDGMYMNLIPPPGVVPIQGLVINEPESGIFFMNGNTYIAFQRESEFHLTPTTQLIRIQNQIKVDSEIAGEMFTKMIYVIEARSDCIEARKIVEKNLDNLG